MYFLRLYTTLSLIASAMLLGISLFNQFVTYPVLKEIPEADFFRIHKYYTDSIKRITLPLMLIEAITFILLIVFKGFLWPDEWLLSALCLIVLWISTWFLFFRMNKSLAKHKNNQLIDEMISLNWMRISLWLLKAALMFLFIIEVL